MRKGKRRIAQWDGLRNGESGQAARWSGDLAIEPNLHPSCGRVLARCVVVVCLYSGAWTRQIGDVAANARRRLIYSLFFVPRTCGFV